MGSIRIENLTKVYSGSLVAVDHLSLNVPHGSVLGFLGPNGAGKTTTAKILTNLVSPTSGTAYINDIEVRKEPKVALSDVGSVVESPEFYPQLTPVRILRFLGQLRGMDDVLIRSRTTELLKEFKLSDRADSRVGGFSKGMKQRLALAQALLHEPTVLILDEPTSGLDPTGMVHIRGILKTLRSMKITILLNSHMLNEVQEICDSIALIDHGRLLLYDDIENLKQISKSCIIEVEFATAPSPEVRGRINELDGIISVESLSPTIFRISCSNGDVANRHNILRLLMSLGLSVSSFVPRGPSLESIYLDRIAESEAEQYD